jgi:hypothetical protein
LKTGSLARRFLILKLQRNIVGKFSYVVNRRSPYFSTLVQMTSYMLYRMSEIFNEFLKHGRKLIGKVKILYDVNKLNMVTSEKEL